MPSDAQKSFDTVVNTIRRLDDGLVSWIGRTPASTDAEILEVKKVIGIRGSLLHALGQLTLAEYKRAAAALADPQQELEKLVSRIEQTTADIKEVKEIVAIAAAAAAIAVQVIALL